MNRRNTITLRRVLTLSVVLAGLTVRGTPGRAALTAVWANTGEDKVTQDELRATNGRNVHNSVWDGNRIALFGAKNEVVSFNLILEAGVSSTGGLSVTFNQLNGPSGATIASSPATGNGVFNWVSRPIELFFVRYLQIKGVGRLVYEIYDERHIPSRLRRPFAANGRGSGTWTDRPGHDKFFPDIAVPLELVPTFSVAAQKNQSIWVDIYIPPSSPAGNYLGTIVIAQNGSTVASLPVQLQVYGFTLPDTPSSKSMVYYSAENINHRYFGTLSITQGQAPRAAQLRDRHYMVAHRHKISLIGDAPGDCYSSADQPCPESLPRLNGSLFTSANGYDGPGTHTGNNVYSIGTYSQWNWSTGTQAEMHAHTNSWANWFSANVPGVEYFLYLIDESSNYPQIQTWASWILSNPGIGRTVKSLATLSLPSAVSQTPSLDFPTSSIKLGITANWEGVAAQYANDPRKKFFMYNGGRPASGTDAVEDDGVAMREIAWGQYKKSVGRWFFWESTYYNNYQGGMGQTNVFRTAMTFGAITGVDSVLGETGWNYSNGDGVFFYPGTDQLFPTDSYGVDGPFASLRLKFWRRGIQDVDYLTMAANMDSAATQAIVDRIVPKVLWEYGVDSMSDPTYVTTDISWSTNPDVWEAARLQLANIITGGGTNPTGLPAPVLRLPSSLPVNAEISATYPSGYNITSYQWSFVPATSNVSAFGVGAAGRPLGATFFTPSPTAQLAAMNLAPGLYRISVMAIDSANQLSPPGQATVSLVGVGTREVAVYPNPWRADLAYPPYVTISGLTDGSKVKIFTVSGHWVATVTSTGLSTTWGLTNDSGDRVASGLYMFSSSSPDGQSARGSFAVIR